MRRLAASVTALVLLLMLSPCAFASEILPRPEEGQIVFVEAENNVDYCADFPLYALKSAGRQGDNLLIELPAARILLRGFFRPLGEWRSLSFSDGKSIGGGDFDDDGRFTGTFSTADSMERHGTAVRAASPLLTVEYSQYGIEILQEGKAVYGELRDSCLELLDRIYPLGKPDWQKVYKLSFEFVVEPDGSLRPSRCKLSFVNGLTVSSVNCAVVCISDSLSLLPISVGRAELRYENAIGQELLRLNIRCASDESGRLYLSSVCPGCGETQGEQLHYQYCGHYSCQEGFSAEGHGGADCGYAGHCVSEGEHSKCKNCLEPMCNGQNHGFGQCLHVHNWTMVSIYTSRCVVCNYEYTSPPKSAG